ncbi:MAG TPA: DNRLRE domain-containing protein [Candidatus Nanopelagicales bacterium]|nr:DNRLRE domain-containing protein [Candidatus Nanopelagicales bacterium]
MRRLSTSVGFAPLRARALALAAQAAALFAACAVAPLAGCAARPDPPVCAGAGVCGAGYCVAGRCRPADAVAAPGDAQRVLLRPEDIAVLSSGGVAGRPEEVRGGAGGRGRLPDAISLGAKAAGSTVVLLRFAATWADDADVRSAFLVLDPVEGAAPAAGQVPLEVARILEPWSSETASWGRQPRLSIPELGAVARRRPAGPLRIDVTRLVQGWAERARDDHGIALLASGRDPVGVALSMGISDGLGPRLEVYVR